MPTLTVKRRPLPKLKRQWDPTRVKALRTFLGMTQQNFADELGVRQQTVSEWEKGMYRPRGATVTLLNLIAERVGFKNTDDK